MPSLFTHCAQVFHRVVDNFVVIFFPPNSPFKSVFFSYFPEDFGQKTLVIPGVISACVYKNEVAILVQRAKLYGETAIAQEMADSLLRVLALEYKELRDFDCITCVPADSKRKIQRGYHIPTIIASRISAKTTIPFINGVHKQKHTQSQILLNKTQRAENVKHVFWSTKIPFKSTKEVKKILLIDDTVTTGATLFAVRDAVLKANPGVEIICAAFAAAPL